MLLDAKSFATSGEGSSGRYVDWPGRRLGIADQVKPKIKSGGPGRPAKMLVQGRGRFRRFGPAAARRLPEHRMARVDSRPKSTVGGVHRRLNTQAKEPDAGRALLTFLTTPAAIAVFKSKGLDPAP